MWYYHFETFIWWLLHKNTPFFALGKWKMAFRCDEKENFLLQHCSPSHDTHVCTIWTHYLKLYHDYSNNIGHLTWNPENLDWDRPFCEGFFKTQWIYQVWYFSMELCHIIWHHAKVLHCFDRFLIFYAHFKLSLNFLNRGAWWFLARGRVSLNLH